MAGSIVSQAAWCTSVSIHYMRPVSDLVLGIISTIMIIILNPGTQLPGKKLHYAIQISIIILIPQVVQIPGLHTIS